MASVAAAVPFGKRERCDQEWVKCGFWVNRPEAELNWMSPKAETPCLTERSAIVDSVPSKRGENMSKYERRWSEIDMKYGQKHV